MFTPAHARTPHTLQKTSSAVSSSVVMRRLAGNVCRANCGFFCRLPPPRIYEQLTIWLLGSLKDSVPQTGPLWLLSGASKLLTGLFDPYSPSSDPPLLGGYLGEALGAMGQLQNYNLNPHGALGRQTANPWWLHGNPCSHPLCVWYTERSGGGDNFGLLNTVGHPQFHTCKKLRIFLLPPDCKDGDFKSFGHCLF